jgi:HAD superfamily hydrolase (TIGR01549 family)
MRFIDRFDVILLDMMQTFMFGGDRFSEHEDYGETYRTFGGHRLSSAEVHAVISVAFGRLLNDYHNPARYDCFPTASSHLEAILLEKNLPESEAELLDTVFAAHETGRVPEPHAQTLRELHKTHRLGVVSNIWCRSDLFHEEFSRAGVAGLFDAVVFSSDHGIIKPSPRIFEQTVEQFGVHKTKVLFVGDDLKCDMVGAKAAGLAAVWISGGKGEIGKSVPRPDLVINELRDLLETS